MRIPPSWTAALLILAASSVPAARGDLVLGTLPQANDDTFSSTLSTTRFKAIAFTMPDSGAYSLDSVVLRLALDGTPFSDRSATTPILRLLNFTGDLGTPGTTTLLTFTTPAFKAGIQDFTFTPGDAFTLQAGQTYWLTLSSAAETSTTGVNWFGSAPNNTPTGIASLTGNRFTNDGGATWVNSSTVNSFAINGSPIAVPEPASLVMVTVGLASIGAIGRNRRMKPQERA
jgi:hypothetical protein